MDVLSAATETVANADAIAAAAATLSVAAAAASSVASSPRASSPTNSTSTRDGAGGGGAVSRPDGSEMDEEDTPSMRSRESSSAMATVVPVAATVPVAGISPAIREAHAKLEAQAEDIRNGKHPKLVADMVVQGGLKRSRLESAKETSKLLNSNIDGLRQAVVRDSDVQTKVALERTQEELLDDVHQRIRKARVDGGLAPRKEASSCIATRADGEPEGEGDKGASAILLPGKKRARLMPTKPFEKVTPEAVLAKAEAWRVRTVTLSDIEMRRDFREIITDWRERATKYLSTYNNSHWTKVNVSPDSFRVRGVTFSKGDPVVVTSRVTGEEFHGEITVVRPKAVFLSLYGGVKTRIFVDHISTGRLTVARSDSKSVQ